MREVEIGGRYVCRWMMMLSAIVLLAGCAGPQERGEVAPEAKVRTFEMPYDVVWRATVDTVEARFEIERRDYEEGVIVTRYKQGRTLVEPWGVDAQDKYDLLEETLNQVRRRCTLALAREEDSVTVEVVVVRERLNYESPPTERDVGPPKTEAERKELQVQATYAAQEQWTFMGEDGRLAARILADIAERIDLMKKGKKLSQVKPI